MTHTIGRVRVAKTRRPAHQESPRAPLSHVLGWAAVVVGLVTAAVLMVAALMSDTAPTRNEPVTTPVERAPEGLPGTPDAIERWLAQEHSVVPLGIPGSADGAERWLAQDNSLAPAGVPRSADGAERWLAEDRR